MIPVPSALAEAIDAPVRQIHVRLSVDWDGDGHGPPGSIDDLSTQVGALSIDRALAGAWPQGVEVAEGSAAAALEAELVTGDPVDAARHAAWWFSRTNPASPLAGKERLSRPCTADIGFTTTNGVEWVRRFTGTTRAMRTSAARHTARLQALDFRERLRKSVALPGVEAFRAGLNATWLVSYVLHQCGIPPSPPARTDAPLRLWMPMHGGGQPFAADSHVLTRPTAGIYPPGPKAWRHRPGPFAPVADLSSTSANVYDVLNGRVGLIGSRNPNGTFNNLSPLRVELWYLGTRQHLPGPVLPGLLLFDTGPFDDQLLARVNLGVDADGVMRVLITARGQTTPIYNLAGPTVPNDGQWHFLGWELNVDVRYVQFKLDTNPAQTVFFGTASELSGLHVSRTIITAISPWAELQVTGPNNSLVWLNEIPFTPAATLDLSTLELDAVTETQPRQAWALLGDIAAAEQAMIGFDETGHFAYRARTRLRAATPVVKTLTAQRSITELDTTDAIDQVANDIHVPYTTAAVDPTDVWVWRLQATDGSEPAIVAANSSLDLWAAPAAPLAHVYPQGQALTGDPGQFPFQATYITAAQNPDGTDLVAANITAVVVYWDAGALQLRVTNGNSFPVYLANAFGASAAGVAGRNVRVDQPIDVAARDPQSVAVYGEQPYHAPANKWVQRRPVAVTLAAGLLGDLAQAEAAISQLEIIGDPRLQLGDRVRVTDRDGLALDGEYLLTGIRETVTPDGRYTMRITARPAPIN